MRVGLVHDWVVYLGGAEKCLRSFHNVYPYSDLYTLFYRPESLMNLGLNEAKVVASPLQNKTNITDNYRRRLYSFPYNIEQLNLEKHDIILSSSHCVAKGVLTRSDQMHICYCHTPMSYAWDFSERFLTDYGMQYGLKSRAARILLHYLRNWDVQSANRVDYFIANSNTVAQRIWRCYRRRAVVIYPPVEVERFIINSKKDNYYLFISRLVPAKMAPMVINVFNRTGQKLKVVGDGPQLDMCRKLAGKNVEVLGYVDGNPLVDLMNSARALIFPAEDAFGIVPVEAQAAGIPVIALARGGARETVVEANGSNWDEATGILFNEQSEEALKTALKQFERWEGKFKPQVLRSNSLRFSRERFEQEIEEYVKSRYFEWQEERVI